MTATAGTLLIGIDCAADTKNVGLAAAKLEDGRARVTHAEIATRDLVKTIASWIVPGAPALLALDAPLGWSVALGDELRTHAAGGSLAAKPNEMFRRRTDDVVHQRTGKRPLDIGADRIARCTHAALGLLGSLRQATGEPIPLAWQTGRPCATSAIEVYPAATLASRRHAAVGYKRAKDLPRRHADLPHLLRAPRGARSDRRGCDHRHVLVSDRACGLPDARRARSRARL